MNTIIRIVLTAIIVLVLDHFLSGITVASFTTSVIVAIVLGLLNAFLKPILVVLSLPVTIVTLGLFMLVINAAIVLICDYFISGFKVDGFITALIFSVLLSVCQWIIFSIFKD
jgi:putative membrane protein